ncbi:MAG: sugar phosphate isomerase/epimerase family protein [Lachnospiraceae bacterium]
MGQVYIVPDRQDMERFVSLAGEYGAAFEYNDFWKPDVLEDRAKQERIIEHYAKFRTDFSQDTMHGAFLDIYVHSEDPLIRKASQDRVIQSMEIAKRMGLRGVVFHTGLLGNLRTSGYLKGWKEKNVRFFTEIAENYPEQNVYMENMFDETPDMLAELAEELHDVKNFGVCLDYAHGAVTGCPCVNWVRTLAPYIRHMHINDNDLRVDLHQSVGGGRIDWKAYDSLMKKYRIDSTVLVEVYGYEAQRESLEYLRRNHIFPIG